MGKSRRPIKETPAESDSEAASQVDGQQLLFTRLRKAEDLVRTARVRLQQAFAKQGSEALHEIKEAATALSEVGDQLIQMGVEDRPFMG